MPILTIVMIFSPRLTASQKRSISNQNTIHAIAIVSTMLLYISFIVATLSDEIAVGYIVLAIFSVLFLTIKPDASYLIYLMALLVISIIFVSYVSDNSKYPHMLAKYLLAVFIPALISILPYEHNIYTKSKPTGTQKPRQINNPLTPSSMNPSDDVLKTTHNVRLPVESSRQKSIATASGRKEPNKRLVQG